MLSVKSLLGSSPIRRNLSANLLGIVIQLFNQIILVPFYIVLWGNDLYSDWIVLSAIGAIFSISNIGLNTVAHNTFTIKYQENDYKSCKSLLIDSFILVFSLMIIAIMMSVTFLLLFDISIIMNIHVLDRISASVVFILILIKVFLTMLSDIDSAIFRAHHKASESVFLDQITNFSVIILTLTCILLGTSIIILASVTCLPYIVLLIMKHKKSKKYFKYDLSIQLYDYKILKSIVVPSLSFMSFPISNTIILQGYTLVVNSFFGADSVVLYNTTRTLCNFVKTILNTIQYSVWPEYSIAYGNKNICLMKQLHRKIVRVSIILSTSIGFVLIILGPTIYNFWTRGAVVFDYNLMYVNVIAIILESLWISSSVTLVATNNHTRLGGIFLASSLFSIAIAVPVAFYLRSLWCVASTLILLHLIMSPFCIRQALKLTNDNSYKFLTSVLYIRNKRV